MYSLVGIAVFMLVLFLTGKAIIAIFRNWRVLLRGSAQWPIYWALFKVAYREYKKFRVYSQYAKYQQEEKMRESKRMR